MIPSIHTQPVRFLGRRIGASLSDSENIETFISTFKNCLNDINSSKHNGIHKVWILQYLLLPRVSWPIQIHEVPFSTILKLEQFTSVYIRKWLKINYIQNELSWKHLLVTSPRLTSFVLGATFDTLPSPTNLKRWHITAEADCSLCSVKVCTTAHVLSGCKVALSQGRYTFRHDSILRALHNSLSKFLFSMSPVKACRSLSSCFVKQGKRFCSSKKKPQFCTSPQIGSSLLILIQALYSPRYCYLLCSEKDCYSD